jgi:hypothetical protein
VFGAAVLVCRGEGDCHAEQGDLRAHSRRGQGRPIPGHGDERVFKRARAVVGDRGRSAPRAGWLFAVDSDQVLRITVLVFAPVAGVQAGGALWARAAGRAGGGGCGLRSG